MKGFFRDEKGSTTIGMVVAMLVALALVFSSVQVYRINSVAAEIQEVADAAALAAGAEVAKFVTAVRVCDATILSLSLLSVCSYALGVAALCVPSGAAASAKLIETGSNVLKARNSFVEKAKKGLDAYQRALAFLSAAQAASAAAANGGGDAGPRYFSAAILVPSVGEPLAVGDAAQVDGLGEAIESESDAIREAAASAEEAAAAAHEAKLRGFERDSGANPSYCMYERAESLAGLTGEENPLFQSVDTWSFSVALERARAYYARRLAQEGALAEGSVEERANSALRKRFYAYALDQVERGYVRESDNSFEAWFPPLFRNTEEMRSTELYDEAVYPMTNEGDALVMHAWEGCPGAAGAYGRGSVRMLEEGEFSPCAACKFTASSLGNVAAASTSIDNGFEFHYAAVAEAASDYQEARAELDPLTEEVKGQVQPLLDQCFETLSDLGSARISASPPGSLGVIAFVVDGEGVSADVGGGGAFVGGEATLGPRAAVSGATLLADSSESEATVISSLLGGMEGDEGGATGALRVVLECWSGLLEVFANGQESLQGALEGALAALPLPGASGLGSWAAGALRKGMEAVGLQPAELDVLKPVLVNTGRIAEADDGVFSVKYSEMKERALSLSASSPQLFSSLIDGVETEALGAVERVEDGFVVAVVELPWKESPYPITLPLPPGADEAGGIVERCFEAVRSFIGSFEGGKPWR